MHGRRKFDYIFFKGLTYPFTSLSRLLIGGLVGDLWFLLIGIPLTLGYAVRCGRQILQGDDEMPEWGTGDSLLVDGLKAMVILIPYGIGSYLVTWAAEYLIKTMIPDFPQEVYFGFSALSLITFIISLPVVMMGQISFMTFIDKADLGKALDPINSIRLLSDGPLEYLKAEIGTYITVFIVSIPLMLLMLFFGKMHLGICGLLVVLLFIFGWVIFVAIIIRTFIWAKFYQRVTGNSVGNPVAGTPAP